MTVQWQLASQFLKSDLDRIDNPDYFMKDFTCTQLLNFFQGIHTMKQIGEKRNEINEFYDRFLNLNSGGDRKLYLQLKWIIVMHEVIHSFKQNSPLFGYTLKALQILVEAFAKFDKKQGPYQKYLTTQLVKPYLQYLCKLCLLNMPDETEKYDKQSILDLETKPQEEESDDKQNVQMQETEIFSMKLVDWYRKFNFVKITLQTFQHILAEVKPFFDATFPYLNNIGLLIVRDLNAWIFKLKYHYRGLKKLNVTIMELDQIETGIKNFSKNHVDLFSGNNEYSLSKIKDFSKQDLKDFLQSPLKPIQIKLFSKTSLDAPLSRLTLN